MGKEFRTFSDLTKEEYEQECKNLQIGAENRKDLYLFFTNSNVSSHSSSSSSSSTTTTSSSFKISSIDTNIDKNQSDDGELWDCCGLKLRNIQGKSNQTLELKVRSSKNQSNGVQVWNKCVSKKLKHYAFLGDTNSDKLDLEYFLRKTKAALSKVENKNAPVSQLLKMIGCISDMFVAKLVKTRTRSFFQHETAFVQVWIGKVDLNNGNIKWNDKRYYFKSLCYEGMAMSSDFHSEQLTKHQNKKYITAGYPELLYSLWKREYNTKDE